MSRPLTRKPATSALVGLSLLVIILWPPPSSADSPTDLEFTNPSDPVLGRQHWAFQALGDLTFPEHDPWSASLIDERVATQRRAKGLPAVDDAKPLDLLRRLTFQLHGLPPSREEWQQFLANEHPNATERQVDRLLASPRFGERWGRHWLDLARYADSNGLDENFLFREAWRYRNEVVQAFNEDRPFDRFVLEQLAGDLLPFDTTAQRDRQRIAAGFLVMGPKVLLGNDPNNQRMEVADEQIDTVGRTFLALTVGCARCHDHKFDPIPTQDYYALAGIFTSTEVMERRYMLGQQRVMERLIGLGDDGKALDEAYESYWREQPKKRPLLAKAKAGLKHLEKGDESALREIVSQNAQAVAEAARDSQLDQEQRITEQKKLIKELEHFLAHPPAIPPRAMIPQEKESPGDEAIRLAGRFDRKGDVVARGFLQVLHHPSASPPSLPENQSGRVQLARWLCDPQSGAGNLTARVLANRTWHHLIGRGLVRTVDNFGRTGETPSHPILLDHLARSLVDHDWSVKHLVREIVRTRTFALGALHDEAANEIDPENKFLWKGHRRRLDPESLRDAMLQASGGLDLSWVDSTVSYLGDQATAVGKNENRRRTDFPCRSLYLPMIRNDLPEVFDVFDFADPHATTGARPETTSAFQGLFLLNDELVWKAAEAVGKQGANLGDLPLAARIRHWHAEVLSAPASDEDVAAFLDYFETTQAQLVDEGHDDPEQRTWTLLAHALFSLSRFQFLE